MLQPDLVHTDAFPVPLLILQICTASLLCELTLTLLLKTLPILPLALILLRASLPKVLLLLTCDQLGIIAAVSEVTVVTIVPVSLLIHTVLLLPDQVLLAGLRTADFLLAADLVLTYLVLLLLTPGGFLLRLSGMDLLLSELFLLPGPPAAKVRFLLLLLPNLGTPDRVLLLLSPGPRIPDRLLPLPADLILLSLLLTYLLLPYLLPLLSDLLLIGLVCLHSALHSGSGALFPALLILLLFCIPGRTVTTIALRVGFGTEAQKNRNPKQGHQS